jgi:mandelate racemase
VKFEKFEQRPILLKLTTDEGIYGIGEAGMAYGVGGSAAVGMIADLAKLIIGKDPLNIEKIWDEFFKNTFWGQGGGTVIFSGISAIDIALWDIKGKALNVPVYQLLGGKTNESLRTYASQIQFGWGTQRSAAFADSQYAENALKAVSEGYDAVKVDVIAFDDKGGSVSKKTGPFSQSQVRLAAGRVEAIRKAVGDDVDIIIENHAKSDLVSAIQLADAVKDYNILFYEEINTPLFAPLLKEAKSKIQIPIASGERIYSRWGYLPFFIDRSIDVIQPDIGSCGGFSEFKKISDMAHTFEISVQAHVAGTGVAEAAAIHGESAIPNFYIHEHHQKALMPEYIELTTNNYVPKNGQYTPIELPGIGQDITDVVYKNSDRILIK